MRETITPHCAKTAIEDGRLRQAQLKMLAMLEVIDSICTKHQLDYWLDAGTLLGAVRHQGFIPWDDDMDIAMPRASYEAFLRVAPEELPDNMWLQTAQTDPGYFNMAAPLKVRDRSSLYIEKHEHGDEPYVQGIFIDVFVYDRMPENSQQRKYYKFLAKKLSRFLSAKYSPVSMGHHASFYKNFGKLLPKTWLESILKKITQKANASSSSYLGRGFNCVGKNYVKQRDIYPLQRVPFETGLFHVPNNTSEILIQQFGNFLSLPPEHERTLRHCKALIPHLDEPNFLQ